MTTEQHSIGYEEGYQAGWNDAMESLPAQQERLPAILESKEAMKLALDALEKLVRFESDSWEIGICRIAAQATRALREALAEQPAQRKPLTDEQIGDLKGGYQSGRIGSFVELIRAIEAAHGIKEKNT